MSFCSKMQALKLPKARRFGLDSFILVLFWVFVILAIRYQIKLLNYIEWGDESETIVVAKMIASGSSLYGQIFNHHGPLTFLPGLITEKFGSFGIAGHRVLVALLQLVSLAAIYFSPLLISGTTKRIYTLVAATVVLIYLPGMLGHTYIYQVLSGLFLVIILAQYTLPAIACPERIKISNILIGNLLLASLPFFALTYLPISALLFLASLRKGFVAQSIAAFFVGGLSNIIFLACIGSIPGYFAFHLYLNAKILPLYNGNQSGFWLVSNALHTAFADVTKMTLLLILVSARTAVFERRWPWRSGFFIFAIISLLMRGAGVQGLPFFYSMLAIPTIFFCQQVTTRWQIQVVAIGFVIICMTKLTLLIPEDREKLIAKQIPESTEFSELARLLTEKNERVIAYTFENLQYILADRLPASGNFFYFPWQEKYNENPQFGIKIDACKEISDYRPKLMLIDQWNVWGKFAWNTYASCIQALMDKEYTQLSGRPYYIRNDFAAEIGLASSHLATKMQMSPPISSTRTVPLFMTSYHRGKNKLLKKIGVMFGTNLKINTGEAELRLRANDGASIIQIFTLSDLVDQKYRYFDLVPNLYSEGEIAQASGAGLSTWESRDEKGSIQTCITYFYADGTRGFTPGCPLF